MEKQTEKDERVVNLMIQSEERSGDGIVISIGSILRVMRKFVAVWLVAAVIAGLMIPVGSAIFVSEEHKNLTAVVSFNFDGIDKGLAPDGTQFDVNSVKSPFVIESALTELNLPLDSLEGIRQGIRIDGVIPSDAIDRITMYRNVYEKEGNLTAGERMIDVAYFPTQYKITFNYSSSGLDGNTAVSVFNTMLTKYREYFFVNYGFNQALGSVVRALDYRTYDYAEAVDVFTNTLNTLHEYVENLSAKDTTRFRSTETGYSFSDLSDTIVTIKNVDLDMISSYVTVNNVTKDKNTLIDYYNFRIETLTREKNVAQDNLKTLNEAIAEYQKDSIVIYGGDGMETSQYSQASAEYDDLFKRKINQTNTLATKTQDINMYQQRINALKGKAAASQDKVEKVEADLEKLNTKINTLLDAINDTANEYYENVYLGNAYSILVPANYSSVGTTKNIINASVSTVLIVEAIIFILYLAAAFVLAVIADNRKKMAISQETAEITSQKENKAPKEEK